MCIKGNSAELEGHYERLGQGRARQTELTARFPAAVGKGLVRPSPTVRTRKEGTEGREAHQDSLTDWRERSLLHSC